MAVKINAVYPPVVESSIPAFAINDTTTNDRTLKVNFTLPMVVNWDDIQSMSIRVVKQSNNKSVVNTDKYYDGIIYMNKPSDDNYVNGVATIGINYDDIVDDEKTHWKANTYYKIQIRFCYSPLYDLSGWSKVEEKRAAFFNWKKQQTLNNSFSEWSNVIVTKAINSPTVKILNEGQGIYNFSYSNTYLKHADNIEHTRFPKIQGGYNNDSEEPLDKYRFRLYEGRLTQKQIDERYLVPYLNSDWLQFNGSGNEKFTGVVEYTFKEPLKYLGTVFYTVFFDTISKNEYKKSSEPYVFTVTEGVFKSLNHIDLVIKDNNRSGYYADKFNESSANTFYAYKKLMRLPEEAIYIESIGSDIIYTTNNSRKYYFDDINNNNNNDIVKELYINNYSDRYPLKAYEDNLVTVEGKIYYYAKDEDGNYIFDDNKQKIKIFKHFYYKYNEDYYVLKGKINPSDETEIETVYGIKFNADRILTDVCGGEIYVYLKENRVILTLDERRSRISEFEQNSRCDENGCLEIYLKNNRSYIETKKYDDITGFSDYVYSSRPNSLDGIYYLIRSDERSNYAIWDDLAKFDFYNIKDFDDQLTLLYEDFTIESGIKYKYAIQRESLQGFRTAPKFEFNSLESSPPHWSNFQYSYIYANGVQVRLDLDVKIQQFKHTRLFQKQDPLNSKYPIILKNGLANYGEFSLGGKITLHSDKDGSFFLHSPEVFDNTTGQWSGGYCYNNDLIISPEKYMELASRYKVFTNNQNEHIQIFDGESKTSNHIIDGSDMTKNIDNSSKLTLLTAFEEPEYYAEYRSGIHEKDYRHHGIEQLLNHPGYYDSKYWNLGFSKFNTNHTNDNIFMERMYRKYVEEFLNDGGYKLYKSPTEGNMIVTLVNVSLVPNQQLNRLIADFNSTVYEVAENTVENIKLYDINPLDVMTNNMYLSFGDTGDRFKTVVGQVSGAFTGSCRKKMKISEKLYGILQQNKLNPGNYFVRTQDKTHFESYDNLPVNLTAAIYDYIENNKTEIPRKIANLEYKYNADLKNLETSSENYQKELSALQQKYKKLKEEYEAEYYLNGLEIIEQKEYADDIYDWIKLREEVEISDERIYRVRNISSIWVELYPKYDLEQELINLKAQTSNDNVGRLRRQMKIAQYELALKQYDVSQSNVITMVINGQEINMFPGRVYHLDNTAIHSIHLKYTRPVLINYTAKLEETDYLEVTTLAHYELLNMGQVAGIFTTTHDILNNHYPERNLNSTIALEKYNYNLYQDLSFYNVIKEKVKKIIYQASNLEGFLSYDVLEKVIEEFLDPSNLYSMPYEEQTKRAKEILRTYQPLLNMKKNSTDDVWVDANNVYIVYHFNGLEELEIEADENTEFIMTRLTQNINEELKPEDIEDQPSILIGPTNKYMLKVEETDATNDLNNIIDGRFAKPTYAIVNYDALVSLEIKANPNYIN